MWITGCKGRPRGAEASNRVTRDSMTRCPKDRYFMSFSSATATNERKYAAGLLGAGEEDGIGSTTPLSAAERPVH